LAAGDFTVSLTVEDGRGGSNVDQTTVTERVRLLWRRAMKMPATT